MFRSGRFSLFWLKPFFIQQVIYHTRLVYFFPRRAVVGSTRGCFIAIPDQVVSRKKFGKL